MKIDRELYKKEKHEQFEHILNNSTTLKQAYKDG
jgi:hypothetical protein